MHAYRLITEDDTSTFCHRVTKALNEGWALYTFDAAKGVMRCAQAVTKDADGDYHPDVKLGDL